MDNFAILCDRVAAHSSRLRKVSLLAGYFQTLGDEDLTLAVGFLTGRPIGMPAANHTLFKDDQPGTLSIGGATLRDAAVAATGLDPDLYQLCQRESGDTGETIGLLIASVTAGQPLSLAAAQELYRRLAAARVTASKVSLLESCFRTYRPLTIKYFVKVITGGMRIGLQSKMVEEAVAAACGAPLEDVRAANNRLGNLAAVALAARRRELHAIEARLFHPMDFMLAKPVETAAEIAAPEVWIVEDKYDGIRSQVHVAPGRVAIFTRGMEDVTNGFPELAAALARIPANSVLDGEVLAWNGGRALAFTVLQQRIARKRVTPEMIRTVPVVFMAYDILYRDGAMLIDLPLEQRRAALESVLAGQTHPVLLSPQFRAESTEGIQALFEDARLHGNEGLILKRAGSMYEPGKRSGAWCKLKRPFATLDVVITAAEQGRGKRATMLSDYTFAVRSGESFVNVGKAYSGLTDAEIRELTRRLRASALDKFGRVVLVRPEIVLEVAFDGIQKSARHKGGFALRFPRIVRWRKDKSAEESDDIERVRALYDSVMNLTASREGE
jgi:DNA ligase-1